MNSKKYSFDIDVIPLNIVIYSYDRDKDDFRFVDINHTAVKTEEMTKEEVIGKYLLHIFPNVKEFGIFEKFKKAHFTGEKQYHKAEFYEDSRISGWRENEIYKIDDNSIMAVYHDVSVKKTLENRAELFQSIVHNSFNEIYIFDTQSFKFSYLNREAKNNIGYSLSEIQKMFVWDIKPLHTEESFKSLVKDQEFSTFETLHQRKDGSHYKVEAKVQKILFEYEAYYVAIVSDITQKSLYEEQLTLSAEVIDSISEAVVITDLDATILDVNPAYLELTGYKREELIGKSPKIFKSGKHKKSFYEKMWADILNLGIYHGKIWDRKSNGELFLKDLTITTVKDKEGKPKNYVGLFSDITKQNSLQNELKNMAFTDALTGLTNRAQFKNVLKKEIEIAQRTASEGALFLVDLDMFKKVNDTLGHLVGDELLVEVASRLQSIVRKADEVSRIGGDEFTIILSSAFVQKKNVQYIAQNIIDKMAQPFYIQNHEIFIGSSIGITFFPSDSNDINQLIKSADLAMYKAKDLGRGNYQFFQSAMNSESIQKRVIEIELRQALANGDIVPYYQPKINPRHGTVVGVEALVRWQHKEKGVLSPAYFLDIAEDSGLVHELGEQVLLKSMQDIKRLNETDYPDLSVAVNLSSKQFDDDELIGKILLHIKNSRFNVDNLELEITESLIMKDVDRAINMMKELQTNGIKLSIDDFGTGYSSLNYLKNFPVSYLKIDKSFIDGISISKQDRAIVTTIMAMAESLDLGVIAEGIEDEDQQAYLNDMSCHLCQGYLYSKPLSFEELQNFLANWGREK